MYVSLTCNAVFKVLSVFVGEQVVFADAYLAAAGYCNCYFVAVVVDVDDIENHIVFAVKVLKLFKIKFVFHMG